MNITWILSASSVQENAGEYASPLASYRYRALNPIRTLRTRGHTCRVHALSPGVAITDHPALHDSDVIVFAKNHSELNEVAALLERARELQVPTLVDVCDDYLAPGDKLGPYYQMLVSQAALVTVSSVQLASTILETMDASVSVVRDAYEGPSGSATFMPQGTRLKGLWFGTPFNLASLLADLGDLPRRIQGYELDLIVLTRECPGLVEAFQQMNARNGGKLRLEFREWSLERNWAELEACDVVVITVDLQSRFFMAKGANRLVETLHAGRFPVVHPLPAYGEFGNWAWVGPDVAEGLRWALANPQEVRKRIADGQAYVNQKYSPNVIAEQWETAMSEAVRERRDKR